MVSRFVINPLWHALLRIKKGCLLEVEVTTVIMAKVLTDIFPASYVLMRVVSEFLSPNQPHPTSMCTVVNQVCFLFLLHWRLFNMLFILLFITILQIFEQLIKESQLDLLQDWVITTLSNFTQGLQIPMAIYCLISFFISSSTNKWLRAMYFILLSKYWKLWFIYIFIIF